MANAGRATLTAYVGETRTHTVTTVDSDGAAVNCSALTLEVIVEQLDRSDVLTIVNADITKTTTTVAFTVDASINKAEHQYRWALRNASTGGVIMFGPYVIQYAANN
jgi:hypothetical protein